MEEQLQLFAVLVAHQVGQIVEHWKKEIAEHGFEESERRFQSARNSAFLLVDIDEKVNEVVNPGNILTQAAFDLANHFFDIYYNNVEIVQISPTSFDFKEVEHPCPENPTDG